MKTLTKFASLCALLITLGYAVTNVDAVTYGLVNGGTGYNEAKKKTSDHTAQQKVTTASRLVKKINKIYKMALNATPVGMEPEELFYEMLNWYPDKSGVSHERNAIISSDMADIILKIDDNKNSPRQRTDKENTALVDLTTRITRAANYLKELKIFDLDTTKDAVVKTIATCWQLDKDVAKLIKKLDKKLRKIGQKEKKGENDYMKKLDLKIAAIKQCNVKFQEIRDSFKVNFLDSIGDMESKKFDEYNEASDKVGAGRLPLERKILLANPENAIRKIMAKYIGNKKTMVALLQTHANRIVEEFEQEMNDVKTTEEIRVAAWPKLVAALSEIYSGGIRTILVSNRMFEIAARRSPDIQQRMYKALQELCPDLAKEKMGMGEESFVPDPSKESWKSLVSSDSVDASKKAATRTSSVAATTTTSSVPTTFMENVGKCCTGIKRKISSLLCRRNAKNDDTEDDNIDGDDIDETETETETETE